MGFLVLRLLLLLLSAYIIFFLLIQPKKPFIARNTPNTVSGAIRPMRTGLGIDKLRSFNNNYITIIQNQYTLVFLANIVESNVSLCRYQLPLKELLPLSMLC